MVEQLCYPVVTTQNLLKDGKCLYVLYKIFFTIEYGKKKKIIFTFHLPTSTFLIVAANKLLIKWQQAPHLQFNTSGFKATFQTMLM